MSSREQSATAADAAPATVSVKAIVVRMLLGFGLAIGAYLIAGPDATLGVLAGAAAVVAGGWLYGMAMLGGGAAPATGVLARLLIGMLGKWVVMMIVLVLALGVAKLPPVAVLAGVIAALAAQMVALARR